MAEHAALGTTMITPQPAGWRRGWSDGLVVAGRNLRRYSRIPEFTSLAVIQSAMFIVLFAYVFGGAIPLPGGGNYREFLMPGIFAQTIVFAAATTAVAMANDMSTGLIDRFRTLPMSRSGVLVGRTTADLVYMVLILIVNMVGGLMVGWRINNGFAEATLAVVLLLSFGFAMAWLGVFMGLRVSSVETAQQLGFTALFPITFLSNVFVPPESLPSVLQPIAIWNPISALAGACRDLFGNPNPYADDSFPGQYPVLASIIWIAVLLAILVPLGLRTYRRKVSR
jgi:ABC-2 type transport system permease protein